MRDLAALEAWLAGAANYELLGPGRAEPFRLDRMQRLVAALGHPQRAAPVVHVAGTKGKGTTCAGVASALDAAGLRTGLYTSPHLIDLRERVRIGARPAPDPLWLAAADEVVAGVAEVGEPFTWFELVTAIGFCVFRRAEVDVAVVEVGLGGRLDATRVVDASVCAITRIGRDHTAVLGETPAEIAAEKAGILAPGVPVVAGPEDPAAVEVVVARAAELAAPLWLLGRDLHVMAEAGPAGVAATVRTPRGERRLAAPLAPGDPARNLGLIAGIVERLSDALGRDLTPGLAPGLARLRWRGRFDVVPGAPDVVVDAAHEAGSARALAAACAERLGPRPRVLLLALARDKRLDEVAAALAPGTAAAVCCSTVNPRAREPAELAAALTAQGVAAEVVTAGSAAALARAQERARGLGGYVLAAGSLYLAGEVLGHLGEDVAAIW